MASDSRYVNIRIFWKLHCLPFHLIYIRQHYFHSQTPIFLASKTLTSLLIIGVIELRVIRLETHSKVYIPCTIIIQMNLAPFCFWVFSFILQFCWIKRLINIIIRKLLILAVTHTFLGQNMLTKQLPSILKSMPEYTVSTYSTWNI